MAFYPQSFRIETNKQIYRVSAYSMPEAIEKAKKQMVAGERIVFTSRED